jgi:hypothetical protein
MLLRRIVFIYQVLSRSVLNWHSLAKGNQIGDELSDAAVCVLVRAHADGPLFDVAVYTATFSTTLQLIWRGGVQVPVTKFKASTALRWPSASGTLCGHSACISSFIPSFLHLFFVYSGINASRICINSVLYSFCHSFSFTANQSLFDTLYSYLHVGCTADYSLLVQALAGVAFQDFDVDSTGMHEKEYERARKMQQDGHVIPSALTVTCGTVTNLGGVDGTLFAVQVVPSQRTEAPCVCVSVVAEPLPLVLGVKRKPIIVVAVVPVHVGTTRSCSSAK